ncbi:MAG: thiolase family protein [Leptospirillia bacterium]
MNMPALRDDDVVIVSAARTPIGSFMGALADVSAPALGAVAIEAALSRAGAPLPAVSEVLMGQVLAAGAGQAPARQAARGAGLPDGVGATAVNKVCGSGLKAVMLAAQAVRAGDAGVVVAGGMESMSRVPHLAMESRTGRKLGDLTLVDGLIADGLTDAYGGMHMGVCADRTAERYDISREAMDAFTRESYRRALAAREAGNFTDEIVPVETRGAVCAEDEEPGRYRPDKIDSLKGAFGPDGRVTAASSSSLNDGAAALVLASGKTARESGLVPIARLLSQAGVAHEPEWFTTTPAVALSAALSRAGLTPGEVDLYEINEAFAVVAMVAMRELSLDPDRVNVGGGAVALGHPIGASGARILVTLLSALARCGGRYGAAALCVGGGEGVAVVVENLVGASERG